MGLTILWMTSLMAVGVALALAEEARAAAATSSEQRSWLCEIGWAGDCLCNLTTCATSCSVLYTTTRLSVSNCSLLSIASSGFSSSLLAATTSLSLTYGGFTGFPDGLDALKNLSSLTLSNNNLQDTSLPSSLFTLPSLSFIDLNENEGLNCTAIRLSCHSPSSPSLNLTLSCGGSLFVCPPSSSDIEDSDPQMSDSDRLTWTTVLICLAVAIFAVPITLLIANQFRPVSDYDVSQSPHHRRAKAAAIAAAANGGRRNHNTRSSEQLSPAARAYKKVKALDAKDVILEMEAISRISSDRSISPVSPSLMPSTSAGGGGVNHAVALAVAMTRSPGSLSPLSMPMAPATPKVPVSSPLVSTTTTAQAIANVEEQVIASIQQKKQQEQQESQSGENSSSSEDDDSSDATPLLLALSGNNSSSGDKQAKRNLNKSTTPTSRSPLAHTAETMDFAPLKLSGVSSPSTPTAMTMTVAVPPMTSQPPSTTSPTMTAANEKVITITPKQEELSIISGNNNNGNGRPRSLTPKTVAMFSDTKEIRAAYKAVHEKTKNWMLIGFVNGDEEEYSKMVMIGCGDGGLDEAKPLMEDNQPQFLYLRLTLDSSHHHQQQQQQVKNRYVFVTVVPESMSGMVDKRAKLQSCKQAVFRMVNIAHLQIQVASKSDLSRDKILSQL